MLKKIALLIVVIAALGIGVFFLIPWGEYESNLEKSEVTQEVSTDSSGAVIPSLSLISGNYAIESGENAQAELSFDVEGLKKTKGAFETFVINFEIAEDFTQSQLAVEIQSASINTGNSIRDEHLAEEDFFDVEKFPLISFESSAVTQTDTGYFATGILTLLDEMKEIDVPFKHLGNGTDKNGNNFEAFEGGFSFDRIEYGMQEVSGAGNVVTINFYCELLKSGDPEPES